MRLLTCVLLVPLATAGGASAQNVAIERTILIAPPTPPSTRSLMVAAGSPTAVEERVWSFDRDGDDRVSLDELPERMLPVMARGDADKDGYLGAVEIAALVDRKPPTFTLNRSAGVNALPTGLTGVVGDLRLTPDKHERAMALVRSVSARNVNSPDSLTEEQMHTRMRELLNEEEYGNFAAAAARPHLNPSVTVSVVFGVMGGVPGR